MKLRLAPIVAACTVAGMRLVRLDTWTGAAANSSSRPSEEVDGDAQLDVDDVPDEKAASEAAGTSEGRG